MLLWFVPTMTGPSSACPGNRISWSMAASFGMGLVLVTSLNIVLLENVLLNIVSVVQTKIFQQKRTSVKLSRCSVAHTSWSSSELRKGAEAPEGGAPGVRLPVSDAEHEVTRGDGGAAAGRSCG